MFKKIRIWGLVMDSGHLVIYLIYLFYPNNAVLVLKLNLTMEFSLLHIGVLLRLLAQT